MCKTLIVEDSATFRQILKESLWSRFPTMEIEEASDGRDILNRIESFHPGIVFMDIRLPGENGLELSKKIKNNYPDVIIVVITSYDLHEYREAARESMADYFVPKGSPLQDFHRNTGMTGRPIQKIYKVEPLTCLKGWGHLSKLAKGLERKSDPSRGILKI